jgi:hypothetical protein
MTPLWNQLKSGITKEEREFNHLLIKSSRSGDYLIKNQDKYLCKSGQGYIHYSFRGDGWIIAGDRKNAQWFSKEEVVELTKGWKGVKIVKR